MRVIPQNRPKSGSVKFLGRITFFALNEPGLEKSRPINKDGKNQQPMDLQKAKIFLEKINREFALMQREPEHISNIDVDILRQYTRDFYDSVLSEKSSVLTSSSQPQPARQAAESPATKQNRPIGFNPERNAPKPAAEPKPIFQEEISYEEPRRPAAKPVVEEVIRPVEPPVFEVEAPAARVAEPPKKQAPPPEPVYQPTLEKITEPVHPTPAKTPVLEANSETLALFEFKAAKELSEKLSELPVADLKKALSLNDRLLMTRELFGGDGKMLEATISTLNSLASFEEAKSYLIQFCAERYSWAEKVRIDHARTFIKLIRRRFK